MDIRLSGRAMSNVVIIDSLVKGQIKSLTLAAGIVFVVMSLALKSFRAVELSTNPQSFSHYIEFWRYDFFNIYSHRQFRGAEYRSHDYYSCWRLGRSACRT